MTTIEFQYSIGDKVLVKPINMGGVIDSMSIDNRGKQYRVVYWNDGDRFSTWLYAWEIQEA